MATLVLRSTNGSPLTNDQVDANFTNLNNDIQTRATFNFAPGSMANLLPNSSAELGNQYWTGTAIPAIGKGGEGTYWGMPNATTATNFTQYSNNIGLVAGVGVYLQAEIFTGGLSAGSVFLQLAYYSSTGTLLSVSNPLTVPNGSGWTFVSGFFTLPTSTTAVSVQFGYTGGVNTNTAIRRIKLSNSLSFYSNEATLYQMQFGSSSTPFNVANATSSNQAVNWGQAGTQLLSPSATSVINPAAFNTFVYPNNSAAITLTVNPGITDGQRVRVYGGAYAVTVQSNVSSGSPALYYPDQTSSYSWTIPAGSSVQYIDMVWDYANWRCTTSGQTVVANATQSNAAVNLSQLGNYNQVIAAFATGTLPSTCWGGVVQVNAGATVTLPTNNPPAGSKVVLFSSGGGSFTLVSNSNQFIYAYQLGLGSTTGPSSLTVQDSGWIEITSRGSGEYDVTGGSPLIFQNIAPAFTNPLVVPNATASNQAVNLGQANGLYAPVAGNSGQTFAVASASSNSQAVNLGQLENASINANFSGLTVTQNVTSLPANYDANQINLLVATNATAGVSFSSSDPRILTAGIGPNGPFIRSNINYPLDLTNSNGVLVPNATASNQAVNLGQANSLYAPVAGNASQTFAVANATASNQAVNWAQAGTQVLTPATSSTITPVAFNTLVYINFSAAGTITVNPGSFGGQRVRVYGCGYTVTTQTNVTSGSPFLAFPDGSTSYTWVVNGYNQAIEMVWDGVNWRVTTTGQIVAAPAGASNQAVNLGQANSLYAPIAGNSAQTFAVASATNATQAIQLQQTVGGGAPAYSNVTSSRSLSSAFTNSLVRPLVVSVGVAGNVNPGYQVTIAVLISGVMVYQRNIYNDGTAARAMTDSAAFVVPPGATYEVQSANSLLFWFEY